MWWNNRTQHMEILTAYTPQPTMLMPTPSGSPYLVRMCLHVFTYVFIDFFQVSISSHTPQPTMPVTTTSDSPYLATSTKPALPTQNSGILPFHPPRRSLRSDRAWSFPTETILGLNFLICQDFSEVSATVYSDSKWNNKLLRICTCSASSLTLPPAADVLTN